MRTFRITLAALFAASFAVGYTTPADATSPMPIVCGDRGIATWGWGQICWRGDKWQVNVQDTRTDGSCVSGVTKTGKQVAHSCGSVNVGDWQTGERFARLVRDSDGRYLTLDNA